MAVESAQLVVPEAGVNERGCSTIVAPAVACFAMRRSSQSAWSLLAATSVYVSTVICADDVETEFEERFLSVICLRYK